MSGASAEALLCGALLLVAVAARGYTVRHLPPGGVPGVLRARVHLGDRLTPYVVVLGAALLGVGALLAVAR